MGWADAKWGKLVNSATVLWKPTGNYGGKSGNGAKSAKSSDFPSRPSLPWQPLSSRQLVNTLDYIYCI